MSRDGTSGSVTLAAELLFGGVVVAMFLVAGLLVSGAAAPFDGPPNAQFDYRHDADGGA